MTPNDFRRLLSTLALSNSRLLPISLVYFHILLLLVANDSNSPNLRPNHTNLFRIFEGTGITDLNLNGLKLIKGHLTQLPASVTVRMLCVWRVWRVWRVCVGARAFVRACEGVCVRARAYGRGGR